MHPNFQQTEYQYSPSQYPLLYPSTSRHTPPLINFSPSLPSDPPDATSAGKLSAMHFSRVAHTCNTRPEHARARTNKHRETQAISNHTLVVRRDLCAVDALQQMGCRHCRCQEGCHRSTCLLHCNSILHQLMKKAVPVSASACGCLVFGRYSSMICAVHYIWAPMFQIWPERVREVSQGLLCI
jgi:hypothetical protein